MSNLASTRLLTLGLVNSLLWSLYLLLTRHVVSGARLDAWAYTLVQLLAAGLVLLWIGRRAAGSWSDLLAPWTVGYAFLRVAINGATAAAVAWLAITQSTLLATISVLIGALSGWLLTRLKVHPLLITSIFRPVRGRSFRSKKTSKERVGRAYPTTGAICSSFEVQTGFL